MKKLVLRKKKKARVPFVVDQQALNHAMLNAAKPILVKSVAGGELTVLECGAIETELSTGKLKPKSRAFLIGKIKSAQLQKSKQKLLQKLRI
ncbi:MAG: hypothetical protein FWG77_04930 [Treponema sp.]|nr:hypothetical protein [Treponema sp.]